MKQYIEHKTSFFHKNKNSKCYFINNQYHGLNYRNFFFRYNPYIYKGYYNMNIHYSHWLEYEYKNKKFKYYL